MRSSVSLFLLSLFLAVPMRAAVLEDVVAKVDGKPLMLSEYRKNLRSVLDTYRRNLPELLADEAAVKELRQKVLDQMIDDEVLAQRADKSGVKIRAREIDAGIEEVRERSFRKDPNSGRTRSDSEVREAMKAELKREGLDEAKFRKRIEKQLKVRKVVEAEVRSRLKEPTDARTEKAFGRLKKLAKASTDTVKSLVKDLPDAQGQGYIAFAFRLRDAHSKRARVAHILIKVPSGASMVVQNKALAKAKSVKKQLANGADFFEIAKKNSDDPESAARGGDIGFILQGWMPPAFEKVAFRLPVGEVSNPVKTDFGYHLIRVSEKKASESLNFDKLRLDIKQFMMNLDFVAELQKLIERLRSKSTIEVKLRAE
jgi:parvulin-like peptidyl-prolyl isomerase